MANLRRWSSSASGNSSVAGGANTINFAEGQTPGSVNNSAREMMAQVRSIYTPAEWGWVEHSATASVASQTSFKISGDQTTNWTAGRRWRLKSGSTTRYGSVISSSYTAETTITVTVDSGSLSASHSLAALSAIDGSSNQLPGAQQSFLRNRIINGDMRIDQRNAGASVTPTVTSQYVLDRWNHNLTVASKYSVQRNAGSVTPPAGFVNYMGVTSLSAYSPLTSDLFGIVHPIEGYNIADLDFGKATAKTITLSFWVRSSLTGTHAAAVLNGTSARSYTFTYTISAANTWEYKTAIIPGDTAGTWATDQTLGMSISFNLGAGSTYATAAGAWTAGAFTTVTGAVSVVGTNAATFYITGVQLEAGSAATPYERRQYGQELSLCQRYYEKMFIGGSCGAISGAGQTLAFTYNYRVPKRSSVTPVHIPATEGITAFPSGSPVFSVITAEGFLAYKISTAANVNANWYVDVYANAEL